MTSPLSSEDRSIEDILAAIRLQAAARAREDQDDAGARTPANDQASLQHADLPKMLIRDDREATASVYPFPRPTSGRLADVLRRAEAILAANAAEQVTATTIAASNVAAACTDPVNREMVSFLDTRMSRMSMAQQPVANEDASEGSRSQSAGLGAAPRIAATPVPRGVPVEMAATVLQDGAVDLLRPLLKQWLTENMPRIVENALRMEVAGMTKTQGDAMPRGGGGNSVV
jgi:cell pole-organizing protein PopZ